MKDLRQTSVDMLPHINSWIKILWKPFLWSGVAFGIFLTSVIALLVPHGTADDDMISIVVGDTLVQLAPQFVVALVVGLVACISGIVFACKAHGKVCDILKVYEPKEFTRQRRSMLWVELSGLSLLWLMAISMTFLILIFSAVQANRCSLLLDVPHIPYWPYVATFLASVAATVLQMTGATFARACFCNLSRQKGDITVALEKQREGEPATM